MCTRYDPWLNLMSIIQTLLLNADHRKNLVGVWFFVSYYHYSIVITIYCICFSPSVIPLHSNRIPNYTKLKHPFHHRNRIHFRRLLRIVKSSASRTLRLPASRVRVPTAEHRQDGRWHRAHPRCHRWSCASASTTCACYGRSPTPLPKRRSGCSTSRSGRRTICAGGGDKVVVTSALYGEDGRHALWMFPLSGGGSHLLLLS
jgi:hypothetical protein